MLSYSPTPADAERAEDQDRALVLVLTQTWLNRTLKIFGGLLLLTLTLAVVFAVIWSSRASAATGQNGQKEALFQTPALNTDAHSALRRLGSKATPAIHLEGSYEEGQGLRWDSGRGQGFSQGGIGLQDNQITIPETGLYFVYSQASFRVACHHQTRPQTRTQTRTQTRPQTRPQTAHQPGSDEEGRQRAPLSHRVGRFSESIGSEVSLMSAVRSPCSEHAAEAGRGWYNAIYLGAVFQLHKGDRLGTETNQLPELETDEGKTFFGVFALF